MATMEEVKMLLKLNIATYNAFANNTKEDVQLLEMVWFENLSEFEYPILKTAFNRAIKKSKFFLTLAHIYEELNLMAKELRPSATQMFQDLLDTHRKVVRWIGDARDFPNQLVMGTLITYAESRDNKIEKAYNKLEPETKAYLVNWQGLKDLGSFDKEEIETYRRAEFLRHCNNFVNTETTKQILNAAFLNSLGGTNLDLLGR